jgi:hypothetical protein
MCSDGCPVSPSILYDQRALMTETRRSQRSRNAMTAYRTRKMTVSSVGRGATWLHEKNQSIYPIIYISQKREKAKTEYRRPRHFQSYNMLVEPFAQEIISTCT